MIPPSQDTSASGDTSPFKRLKVVDTSAFTSIVTSSRLIGYYPEGQTSVVVGTCDTSYSFSIATVRYSTVGRCCAQCSFQHFSANGSIISYLDNGTTSTSKCSQNVVTLTLYPNYGGDCSVSRYFGGAFQGNNIQLRGRHFVQLSGRQFI
ncbi:Condensin complex subunit 2 [Apiospora arundinis]